LHIIITIILIGISAFFSGANLGLMTLDPYDLSRKVKLGDQAAAKVYSVRRHGNQLLVTLLLGNVAVNAILAVYLGSLTTGLVAVLLSTALITIFAEILPQALFIKYSMSIGVRVAGLVKVIMWVLSPICVPIAWLLNRFLGDDLPTVYSKEELVKIMEEHTRHVDSDVEVDEERIVRGALTFGDRTVSELMTPWSVVKTVSVDQEIDRGVIKELLASGFSRFPVLSAQDQPEVVGILYLRDLADPASAGQRVAKLEHKPATFIRADKPADNALQAFIKLKRHLFVVTNADAELVGVITIEDVLEAVLGQEIVGEFDAHTDMRKVAARQGIENKR